MSKYCPSCGTSLNDDDKFCSNCGAKFVDNTNETLKRFTEIKENKVVSNTKSVYEKNVSQPKTSKKSPKVFIILGIVALSLIPICILAGIFVGFSVNTFNELNNDLLDNSEIEISQTRTEFITETSEETTIATQTEYTDSVDEEEKEAYLSAKKMADKDNSEINVTYCSQIKAFLDGEDVSSNANMIYDYGNMSGGGMGYDNLYSHSLSFVNQIDGGIFCGLNIGMPYSQINYVLGEPNGENYTKDAYIYYFDGYCVAFYGEDTIKCIGIIKMPPLDESYKNIFNDTIKWIKETGWVPPEEGEFNYYDYQIYEKLVERYPDYSYFTTAQEWYIDYPNGFSINGSFISIEPSYYGSFDYIDTDLEIFWGTEDEELSTFKGFCDKYFSDEWVANSSKTYTAYCETNCRYYNGCVYVRTIPDNQFKTVYFGAFASDIDWLSDTYFICNTHLYGPFVVNAETMDKNPIDVNHQDYSEMTYSIDADGNIVTTDENDEKTVYSVEDIIKEFGT